MELRRELAILADAAKYDASCSSSGGRRKTPAGGLGNSEGMGICHSYTPDGRCVSLLKILLTNECVFDCQYCINRASSGVERARFSPADLPGYERFLAEWPRLAVDSANGSAARDCSAAVVAAGTRPRPGRAGRSTTALQRSCAADRRAYASGARATGRAGSQPLFRRGI